jgi:hypothetical protein
MFSIQSSLYPTAIKDDDVVMHDASPPASPRSPLFPADIYEDPFASSVTLSQQDGVSDSLSLSSTYFFGAGETKQNDSTSSNRIRRIVTARRQANHKPIEKQPDNFYSKNTQSDLYYKQVPASAALLQNETVGDMVYEINFDGEDKIEIPAPYQEAEGYSSEFSEVPLVICPTEMTDENLDKNYKAII